ncbi:MAG: hypothetical protein GY730_02220 [bacterium]|nr:hypothetical protein [bacterium]
MAPPRKNPIEKDRKCINAECEYFNKEGSMAKAGKSGKNDNFQCCKCKKGYSSTYGTIFRRKRTEPKEIVRVLKSLAEGNSIRGASRIFGHDKDAIINWLKQAGQHCEKFEQELVDRFNFTQVQIDELWTFIVKKTTHAVEKKGLKKKQ